MKYHIHKQGKWWYLCEYTPATPHEWCSKIYGVFATFEGAVNAFVGQTS